MGLVLASASPRRADLLRAAGFTFDVRPADVDERRAPDEPPDVYVLRVAAAKADAVARSTTDVVLAADTTVALGTRHDTSRIVLGKPADAAEAARMLRHLSGSVHEVLTGVVVTAGDRSIQFVDSTEVWFAPLSDEDIAWYVSSGEPMDKAGAYAIQGLASRFIPRISGSYSNVVGLPVARVSAALRELMNGR
jgi:septum formation protein